MTSTPSPPNHVGMERLVMKWELVGIAFVFLAGALLHFVFAWSGEARVVALFASVNESVWEHFKQGFFPMCVYAFVEWVFLRRKVGNLLTAKAVAVYVLPAITGLVFYGYTAVVGEEILMVDILIFLAAIIVAQLISYRILVSRPLPGYAGVSSAVFILALAAVLMLFTFYPPHLPIFMDGQGFYGLP